MPSSIGIEFFRERLEDSFRLSGDDLNNPDTTAAISYITTLLDKYNNVAHLHDIFKKQTRLRNVTTLKIDLNKVEDPRYAKKTGDAVLWLLGMFPEVHLGVQYSLDKRDSEIAGAHAYYVRAMHTASPFFMNLSENFRHYRDRINIARREMDIGKNDDMKRYLLNFTSGGIVH